jgi:hypothetical protein
MDGTEALLKRSPSPSVPVKRAEHDRKRNPRLCPWRMSERETVR